MITAIETQGRYYQGIGQEYVEEYMVEYRRADFPEWRPYKKRDGSISVSLYIFLDRYVHFFSATFDQFILELKK